MNQLKAKVVLALDKETKVSGATAQPSISYGLNSALSEAEGYMRKMGDEYLSVELSLYEPESF